MMHNTQERDDKRQACCDPAPRSGGSCCGGAVESEPAEKQSACCGAPAQQEEPARRQGSCCGAPSAPPADYPYGPAASVAGALDTPAGPILKVSRAITRADRLGAWRVRWGFGRSDYRVKPDLYALGAPTPTSPVLVTGNYKLTLDRLRSSLEDLDAWLLVVDTRGINVWCAAGKGTFCAEEVARMVRDTRLDEVVEHRRLVLPQLSAPGVAAHKVKEACGFRVTYGPVRAADLPAFLAAGMKADAEMRKVTFDLGERAVLAPAELAVAWDRRMLLAYGGILAVSAIGRDGVSLRRGLRDGAPVIGAAWLALLAGGGATPLALPWLPGRAFSLKGAVAGGVVAAAATATLWPRALARRQARAADRCPGRLFVCGHELHRLLADHLALRRGARDAQGAALAGRRGCSGSRRLAGQQTGKVRAMRTLRYIEEAVTLELDVSRCNGCGMCVAVCPHAVFAIVDDRATLADRGACMECGACALNCTPGAISVEPGVGCAQAIINGWLTGGEPNCDC